jgi:hypothetical protein
VRGRGGGESRVPALAHTRGGTRKSSSHAHVYSCATPPPGLVVQSEAGVFASTSKPRARSVDPVQRGTLAAAPYHLPPIRANRPLGPERRFAARLRSASTSSTASSSSSSLSSPSSSTTATCSVGGPHRPRATAPVTFTKCGKDHPSTSNGAGGAEEVPRLSLGPPMPASPRQSSRAGVSMARGL